MKKVFSLLLMLALLLPAAAQAEVCVDGGTHTVACGRDDPPRHDEPLHQGTAVPGGAAFLRRIRRLTNARRRSMMEKRPDATV